MILHELNNYYMRLLTEGEKIPEVGFSQEKISFAIVIDKCGNFLRINDLRETEKKFPRSMIAPKSVTRTSNPLANFLWDKSAYILGIDEDNCNGDLFKVFKKLHCDLSDKIDDEGFRAVVSFLEIWNPGKAKEILSFNQDLLGANLVFQLETDFGFVHERPIIKKAWLDIYKNSLSTIEGQCLVCGEKKSIAKVHTVINGGSDGVKGVKPSGAQIVSFNNQSFCSFNKKQSLNAPVSEDCAFAYATALNHLLRFDSRQKIQIGDATTVFWAERKSPVEDMFGNLWDPKDMGDEDSKKIRDFLEAVRDGKQIPEIENDLRFYILGLSPNAARISVRYWVPSTAGEIIHKMNLHFNDIKIEKRSEKDPEFPSIWAILKETAVLGKKENISPLLSGQIMNSILSGRPYPDSLLWAMISRIKANDHKNDKFDAVNYIRTAVIKACLLRKKRFGDNQIMEVGMSLDLDSQSDDQSVAYRLGRLFAVLEKAQIYAVNGVNSTSTIRDRFFGAASATPNVVFPQLIRLSQHHIQKLQKKNNKSSFFVDKLIEEILSGINSFPAHLKLSQQGEFSIGYYHQRQAFYKKSTETTEA